MDDTHILDDNTRMRREKNRVALTSVLAAVFLTAAKLGVGLWTGSLGILSEAAHSGLDLLAAAVTLFAVRVADRPADRDHHFGHGKVENLSALFETLLLLFTCFWILTEAWERFTSGEYRVDVNIWSFVVIILSVAIDYSRSRALSRVARKYNSQALAADALHFSTDIWSSLVVIVGLASVALGFPAGDTISASGVACIVIWISLRLGKRTVDVLLDRVPSGIPERVRAVIEAVPGVRRIEDLRVRQSGAKTFIDTRIGIARTASFDEAHDIMETVEQNVTRGVPRSDIMIHSEPVIGDAERLPDSIHWLVRREGLMSHNLSLLAVDGALHLDLDIEFPPGTAFADAHRRAERVEQRIRESLPSIDSVCIHLEEQAPEADAATDVTDGMPALVEAIGRCVASDPDVRATRDIRCYDSGRGLIVTITCALPAGFSLKQSHSAVNRVELAVMQRETRIAKVFIHAEPEEEQA
jgi:cation diffusion facilitator family transporter